MFKKSNIILSGLGVWLLAGALLGQSAHRALRQGDQQYADGDYASAQAAYQKANNSQGYYNAGNAAMQQLAFDAAATFYQKAAENSLSPQLKADALYNLGNVLLRQKKAAEAIGAYEQSLRIAPNHPDAQKNLQIAKRQTPPSPPAPPPPPPPPSSRLQRVYVDQALAGRQKEVPPTNLSPDVAQQMLLKAVLPEEQKNAKAYRELAPANSPSRVKKDW